MRSLIKGASWPVIVVAIAVAGLLTATASGASPGSSNAEASAPATTGFHGPTISKYQAAPATYAAGAVCTFPVHIDFPVNKVIQRTWTDDSGNPVFATAGGVLIARVTNLATGRSLDADLTGVGTFSYPGDGSLILSGNGILAVFGSGDTPHNKIILSLRNINSYISVRVATVNGVKTKKILEIRGPREDYCRLLA